MRRITKERLLKRPKHHFSRLSDTSVLTLLKIWPARSQGTALILIPLQTENAIQRRERKLQLHPNPIVSYMQAKCIETSSNLIASRRLWTRLWFLKTSSRNLLTGTNLRCKSYLRCFHSLWARSISGIGIADNPIHIITISFVMRQSRQQSNSFL